LIKSIPIQDFKQNFFFGGDGKLIKNEEAKLNEDA